MRIVTESCFRCFQVSSLPVSWIGKERDNVSIVSEVSSPWNFLGERTLSSQRIGLQSERRSHDRRGIDTLASVTFRGCDLPSSFSRGVQWSRVPPWRGITPVGNRFTTRRKVIRYYRVMYLQKGCSIGDVTFFTFLFIILMISSIYSLFWNEKKELRKYSKIYSYFYCWKNLIDWSKSWSLTWISE